MAITPPWALHVDGSNRFNRLTTVGLTVTVTADSTPLIFTGNFTNTTSNATYSTNGECVAGARGRVTGINIPYIADQLNGTFTNSVQRTLNVAGDIAPSAAPVLRLALKSPELSLSTRPAIQARSSPH
jgi:hypothetical protein